MAFRARKLLVQLPCGEPTVVDALAAREARDASFSELPCDWVFGSAPPCRSLSCLDLPCNPPFATPCPAANSGLPPECPAGFITPDVHCRGGTISLPDCPNTEPPRCAWGISRLGCEWLFQTERCPEPSCEQGTGCFHSMTIVVEPEHGTMLADPEALPLLKRHLERRLAEIEAAELAKEHVEARLRDIERAEQQLRERDDES